MLRRILPFIFMLPFIFLSLAITSNAWASEKQFFKNIQGKWTGPGEIVAGKYKGTKFTCVFDGIKPDRKIGMNIDGYCRVGMFSQPMNAHINKFGGRFTGKFLDGAIGEGMDITGGRYSKSRFVADIKRKDLIGAMVARQKGKNKLNITISVKVDGRLIPVIGIFLDRVKNKGPKFAKNLFKRKSN
ncbi:MAG: hypothetical protein COC00_006930 [Rhizobiales bacterium]|nr:hypothetical protein [Hyphomicrobiales bacterium]